MSMDLLFAPELTTPEPSLIDWAHRSADDELARLVDNAVAVERG